MVRAITCHSKSVEFGVVPDENKDALVLHPWPHKPKLCVVGTVAIGTGVNTVRRQQIPVFQAPPPDQHLCKLLRNVVQPLMGIVCVMYKAYLPPQLRMRSVVWWYIHDLGSNILIPPYSLPYLGASQPSGPPPRIDFRVH